MLMRSATLANNVVRALRVNRLARTEASVARRSCWSVGFFPPVFLAMPLKLLLCSCKEEMANYGEYEMPLNRAESSDLEVIQPEQPLLVLEAPLDMPTRECHVQYARDRCCGRGVGNKVLDLTSHRVFGID